MNDQRPAAFHQPSFDAAAWPAITVPGCMEVQGYGTPLYKNIGYYFKVDPPFVMGEPDPRYTTTPSTVAMISVIRAKRKPRAKRCWLSSSEALKDMIGTPGACE